MAIADVEGLRPISVDGDVHIGRPGVPEEISTARGGIIIGEARRGEARRGEAVLRTQHGDISSPPPAPPPRWTPTPDTAASATP
ncbi:hypothetical protein ACFWWM_26745 [Streptomyces sp. NPDC058682]|uniref:hypothetical protein n=1 Tax=Streptomyces sp. NPDC058682 TaxID=3346596 RepID=UPI003669E93E